MARSRKIVFQKSSGGVGQPQDLHKATSEFAAPLPKFVALDMPMALERITGKSSNCSATTAAFAETRHSGIYGEPRWQCLAMIAIKPSKQL